MTAIPFIRPAISTDENSILALLEELENRVFDAAIFTDIFQTYLADSLTFLKVAVAEIASVIQMTML